MDSYASPAKGSAALFEPDEWVTKSPLPFVARFRQHATGSWQNVEWNNEYAIIPAGFAMITIALAVIFWSLEGRAWLWSTSFWWVSATIVGLLVLTVICAGFWSRLEIDETQSTILFEHRFLSRERSRFEVALADVVVVRSPCRIAQHVNHSEFAREGWALILVGSGVRFALAWQPHEALLDQALAELPPVLTARVVRVEQPFEARGSFHAMFALTPQWLKKQTHDPAPPSA